MDHQDVDVDALCAQRKDVTARMERMEGIRHLATVENGGLLVVETTLRLGAEQLASIDDALARTGATCPD